MWQPIETAPRDGTYIHVGAWVKGEWEFQKDKWESGKHPFWGFSNGAGKLIYPTHWMPLPEPPAKVAH